MEYPINGSKSLLPLRVNIVEWIGNTLELKRQLELITDMNFITHLKVFHSSGT